MKDNIYTYVRERGHILFSESPLNEADNLVFSVFCYLDMAEVIPAPGHGKVRLHTAAVRYFKMHELPHTSLDDGTNSSDALKRLFVRMARAPRYRDIMLSSYVDVFSKEKSEQFSALCLHYAKDRIFVVFRGTSSSLVGWKEDFILAATGDIYSQKDAASYLNYIGKHYPGSLLDVGGHSKGGHLAVYSSANVRSDIQDRIQHVWSNDGPGLEERYMDTEGYRAIEKKILYYVPAASLASMLYPHNENFTVVGSYAKGLVQHDAKTWIIRGDRFVTLHERTAPSIASEEKIIAWLEKFPEEDLPHYADVFFDVLYASGAETFPELASLGARGVLRCLNKIRRLPKKERRFISQFMVLLFRTARSLSH